METEEQGWEQELEETSLTLSRSRFRNANTAVVTDAQHANGNSESNGHHKIVVPSNSNSATASDDDNNGIHHPVSLLDREKIAALTQTQVEIHSKDSQVTDSQTESSTSVYYDPEEGTKLNSTYSGEEHVLKNPGDGILDISTGDVSLQKNFDSILESNVDGNKKNSNSLSLQDSKILSEEYGTSSNSLGKNEIEHEDVHLINASGLEVTEIDLEGVLEKQNTHDLFCPNCNSCITRRVILRKRKRGVRITSEDVKRNKQEAAVDFSFTAGHGLETSNQIHDSAEIYSDGTPKLAGNDYDHDRKPDIFRCLSCFSFFIPTGNGFKIFRMFKDKGLTKPVQDKQKSKSKSWISSIFGSLEEPTSEPGRDIRSDGTLTTRAESLLSSSIVNAQSFSTHRDLSRSSTHEFEGPVKNEIAESQEDGDKISHNLAKEQLVNGKKIPSIRDNSKNATEMNTGDIAKEHFEAVTGSQTSTSDIPIYVSTSYKSGSVEASADRVPVINGKLPENVVPGSQTSTSNVPKDVPTVHESGTVEAFTERIPVVNGKFPENVVLVSPPDGLKLLISPSGGSPTREKLGTGQNPDLTVQNSGKVDIFHEDVLHVGAMIVNNSDGGESATVKQISYGMLVVPPILKMKIKKAFMFSRSASHRITNGIYAGELVKINKDLSVLSAKDIQFVQGGRPNITKDLGKVTPELTEGKDTIIVVEAETVYKSDSQLSRNLNVSEEETETGASPSINNTRTSVTEERGADGRESYGIEIIKSIVYGGLIESIVSLSVVSSAAGSSTGTLNIVTLSLANVIGGLILMFHNLWDLKKDNVSNSNNNQPLIDRDRYEELLGRRERFWLHLTVAMLSFLIFGLIPPITYGWWWWWWSSSPSPSPSPSPSRSRSRELKVLATAAAALASILVLASGKAYVRRPPRSYLKTIAYFILVGFMASGISFAVGALLAKLLLEKLPHFHSSATTASTHVDWASY